MQARSLERVHLECTCLASDLPSEYRCTWKGPQMPEFIQIYWNHCHIWLRKVDTSFDRVSSWWLRLVHSFSPFCMLQMPNPDLSFHVGDIALTRMWTVTLLKKHRLNTWQQKSGSKYQSFKCIFNQQFYTFEKCPYMLDQLRFPRVLSSSGALKVDDGGVHVSSSRKMTLEIAVMYILSIGIQDFVASGVVLEMTSDLQLKLNKSY